MRIPQRPGVADSVTRRVAPVNEWWTFAGDGSVPSGPTSEVPRQLPHAPVPAGLGRHDTHPRRLRSTRLVDLVGTVDAKLVAAAYGMRNAAVIAYLADHVDAARLPNP
jgi:hypothetical protein